MLMLTERLQNLLLIIFHKLQSRMANVIPPNTTVEWLDSEGKAVDDY